ncbi:unnamed protein product [Alternaria sp. RS040]
MSAVTTLPISDEQDLSDNEKDIAIQTVYLQDAYEDADRIAALISAWCTTQTGITLECEEAWYDYIGSKYAHRTYQEEIEDLDEEKFTALWGTTFTTLHYVRSTPRDVDSIWFPCYGEQLGEAYDSDQDYSYHGTML